MYFKKFYILFLLILCNNTFHHLHTIQKSNFQKKKIIGKRLFKSNNKFIIFLDYFINQHRKQIPNIIITSAATIVFLFFIKNKIKNRIKKAPPLYNAYEKNIIDQYKKNNITMDNSTKETLDSINQINRVLLFFVHKLRTNDLEQDKRVVSMWLDSFFRMTKNNPKEYWQQNFLLFLSNSMNGSSLDQIKHLLIVFKYAFTVPLNFNSAETMNIQFPDLTKELNKEWKDLLKIVDLSQNYMSGLADYDFLRSKINNEVIIQFSESGEYTDEISAILKFSKNLFYEAMNNIKSNDNSIIFDGFKESLEKSKSKFLVIQNENKLNDIARNLKRKSLDSIS